MMSPRGRSYTIEREEAEGGCEAQSHHSHRRRQHHLRCVCAAGAADRQKGPTEKHPVPLFTPTMASKCPKCEKTVYFAEKVSSLGKDWHKFCLKCERCNKTLNPGGHAEHDGKPYCHKPCYATLFGPKGVNIGGAGSYVYDNPVNEAPAAVSLETNAKPEEEKKAPARGPVKESGAVHVPVGAKLQASHLSLEAPTSAPDATRQCILLRRCHLSGRTGTGLVCAVRDAIRLWHRAAMQSMMGSLTATNHAMLYCLDQKA
uniref:LIM zinc-binding domain-containing protein n=1 Tax=Astatotilapia calliptera TaxID=8154 RepID=A0A3P8NK64_ASTCA